MTNKNKKNKKVKIKKKLGFSEKLVLWVLLASWLTVISGVVYAYVFISEMVWASILEVVKWLSTGTIGFFIWKAKAENMVRIKDNPNFNLQDYIQQTWDKVMEEGNRLDDNNVY